MKTILLLGAGLVARPLVRYLLDKDDVLLNVASMPADRARQLVNGHPRGNVFELDARDGQALSPLLKSADLVISLLPYTFHVAVARLCLEYRKHLVTASYLSTEMISFDDEAKQKGLLFLNEIGLDPGIDHMSAMKIKDDVEKRGGRILSFESCCGGLPAPEANDNPFGYKFSWSPRGVLMAGRNSAKYRKNGDIVDVPGSELFRHHWIKEVNGLGAMEVYPNRNSLVYEELYNLKDAETFFRGTFRYPGWCETIEKIIKLGFLSEEKNEKLLGVSYAEMLGLLVNFNEAANKRNIAEHLNVTVDSQVIERMEWLGLFSDEKIASTTPTPIDILTVRMLQKMAYSSNERDMVVLQHDFTAEFAEGKKRICSLLLDYGDPAGDSSMARTVSLPTAIAAHLIVNNKIDVTGVKIPTDKQFYEPVLEELERLGISLLESSKSLP